MAMASDKSSAFRVVILVRAGVFLIVEVYFHGDLHQGSIAARETS